MKWTTATALLLALAAGGAGVAIVTTREPKSPAEVLSSLRSQMGRPLFDSAAAIRELDDVLEGEAGPLTVALERGLLRARADVYESIGSIGRAREDVERILASHEADAASQTDPASVTRIQSLTVEVIRLQSDEGELVAALERAERLSAEHPDHAEVWVLQGNLAERLAREGLPGAVPGLDELLERVRRELSAERFEEAHALIVGLTAREPGDPEIQEIEARLTRAFEGSDEIVLRWVLESVNEPRKWFSAARAAYTRALGVELPPAAVMRLADSLERAGQRDLAIEVQSIARRDPEVATEPAIAESFLRDLAAAGRTTEARDLVTWWDWALGATTEFYRFAGELLFEAGELEALGGVAEGLLNVGEDTAAYWARGFFSSLANVAIYERQASRLATATEQLKQEKDPAKREELRTVRDSLRRWIDNFRTRKTSELRQFARDTINPEPFAGARQRAAFYAAEASRLTGRANLARSSFSFALAEDPDGSAEAWANYAELLEAVTLLKDAEEALSHAMSLDPGLTAELAPRWFSLGEALLESNGTTLATLIDQCARQGTYLPAAPSVLRSRRSSRRTTSITSATSSRSRRPERPWRPTRTWCRRSTSSSARSSRRRSASRSPRTSWSASSWRASTRRSKGSWSDWARRGSRGISSCAPSMPRRRDSGKQRPPGGTWAGARSPRPWTPSVASTVNPCLSGCDCSRRGS